MLGGGNIEGYTRLASKARLVAALLLLPLTAACGSSTKSTQPRPGLVFNRSIGRVWIGEPASRVRYDLGMGKSDDESCVLMDEASCPPGSYISKYAVKGGYMRVAIYKNRVVDIETNAPKFKTSDGIGVGARIPYANPKVMDAVRFRYFTPYCSCWWGWFKEPPKYPQNAKSGSPAVKRWLIVAAHAKSTILTVDKGKVVYVYVARGDVNFQF